MAIWIQRGAYAVKSTRQYELGWNRTVANERVKKRIKTRTKELQKKSRAAFFRDIDCYRNNDTFAELRKDFVCRSSGPTEDFASTREGRRPSATRARRRRRQSRTPGRTRSPRERGKQKKKIIVKNRTRGLETKEKKTLGRVISGDVDYDT